MEFIRQKIEKDGYQEISTPVMVKNQLFKKSGHWEHFGEHNMFNLAVYEDEEIESGKIPTKDIKGLKMVDVNYSLKPMNCPESAIIYSARHRSYHELPIKLSEFGILHRRELSGVLGGTFRVRQFIIDDAHLFVRPDQIQEEIHKLILLVLEVYKSLNFTPRFYLATKPDKAMGDKKTWKEAEKDLQRTLKDTKVDFAIKPKDGAFYGPKIDIHIKDSQDRDWQLATIQLDFQIPQKMELSYTDKDGQKKRPVMIHRAIFGSFERFVGIITEHFQGAFPVWLSPIQVIVLPISDKFIDYAKEVKDALGKANIRTDIDERNETLQAKIRDATLQKIPYLVIVGAKEQESGKIAIRTRDGKDLGQMPVNQFTNKITEEIENKS